MYYGIGFILVVFYAWWRGCQWRNRYGRAGDGHPAYVATNQATVVKLLRRRAFTLETWAHCLLAGIIAILFGGLYFTIFVLPQVVVSDVRTVLEPVFKSTYAPVLERIVDGRYWLKVAEVPALEGKEPVVAAFFSDGRAGTGVYKGIVGRAQGSVFLTADGGRTWSPSEFRRESLKDGEWLVAAAFARDGSHGVLFGSLGTIWSTADEGRTWRTVDAIEGTGSALTELPPNVSDVTEAVVTASLEVARTSSGSTHLNIGLDNSSSNTPSARTAGWKELTNLHLRAYPYLQAMALNHDAGIIAVSPSLLFMASDGGASWRSTQSRWPGGGIVSLSRESGEIVVISTNGKRLTEDGGNARWIEADFPVVDGNDGNSVPWQDGEQIIRSLFRNNELRVLIGSLGTVVKKIDTNSGHRWTKLNVDKLALNGAAMIAGGAFDINGSLVLFASDGGYVAERNPAKRSSLFSDVTARPVLSAG